MTPAQITGSTFRGGLLRGAVAGAVALLVVYGVLFLTAGEQTATATAPCENGTAVSNPADNRGLVSDCIILLAVKDTLRGTETLNWSATLAIGSWEGITVSGTPGRVTELNIDGWTSEWTLGRDIVLNGSIPAQLGRLAKLRRLDLPRNALTGAIPAELGNLSELTILRLYGNRLTSAIPPELGRLSDLMRLDLSRNRLTGGIPVELGRLSDLMSLRLHNNRLTGAIPASLGDPTGLNQLNLAGNAFTGCIPASLRGTTLNDLSSLSLSYCTTTTTYTLTTSVTGNGRTSPLAGAYSYLSGASVTVTATPDAGWQVASWSGDCTASGTTATCALTMSANKTASVTFERITYTLTVTAGAGGSVTHDGGATLYHGDEVPLAASWNDATHSFTGWGGDCSGTTSTCKLTMDAAKTVTATFAALPATRCATTTATDCIRAVYLGAPDDYAQVSDIPADLLLTPNSDGRYYVERGRQYTVVTAAPLPTGWTRFYLDRTPLGTPWPVSFSQLIKPVGTTYTFTVTEDDAAATLITFDLKQARPFIRPRPDGKPEIGDTVVTTVFSVVNCESGVAVPNPTTNTKLVEDCASLLKAKDRLAGTATLNWSAGRPMTTWTGVTITGTPQRVTKLELANSGLTGELQPQLGNLTALTELRLNDNDLTGVIPAVLGDLDNLTKLYLNNNSLTGLIPSRLEDLTALTHAYLAGSDGLRGCVPRSFDDALHNDASSWRLSVCAVPTAVQKSVVSAPGTYQIGGVTLDVPEGVTFHVSSGDGDWLLHFGPLATETKFINIAQQTVANIRFSAQGEFISMDWNDNYYPTLDGPSVELQDPQRPPRGTRGIGVGTPIPKTVWPSTESIEGPTLEQLRLIALSIRPADAPAPDTPPVSISRGVFGGQDIDGPFAAQEIAEGIPFTAPFPAERLRNFTTGSTVPVCSKWPLAMKKAISLWENAAGSQNPDETLRAFYTYHEKTAREATPYSYCEAKEVIEEGISGLSVYGATKRGMRLNGCADDERVVHGCARMRAHRLPPYYTVTDAVVLIYEEEAFEDYALPDGFLLKVITHEIGHYLTGRGHPVCDESAPEVSVMHGYGPYITDSAIVYSRCHVMFSFPISPGVRVTDKDIELFNENYDMPAPELSGSIPLLCRGEFNGQLQVTFSAWNIQSEHYMAVEISEDDITWREIERLYPPLRTEPASRGSIATKTPARCYTSASFQLARHT